MYIWSVKKNGRFFLLCLCTTLPKNFLSFICYQMFAGFYSRNFPLNQTVVMFFISPPKKIAKEKKIYYWALRRKNRGQNNKDNNNKVCEELHSQKWNFICTENRQRKITLQKLGVVITEKTVRQIKEYLTVETAFMLICCGWFIGDGVRAPMGACDICAFCIAIGLNWLIPVGETNLHDFIRNRICNLIFSVLKDRQQHWTGTFKSSTGKDIHWNYGCN